MKKLCTLMLVGMLTIMPFHRANAIFGLGDIVFDPGNYAQNILTAARTLAMIQNQITQLQNEAAMLVNQGKNLGSLNFNILNDLNENIAAVNHLMNAAQGIAFTISETDRILLERYPDDYSENISRDQLIQDAKQRYQYSVTSLRHSMRMQAHVTETIADDQALISQLMASSHSAAGNLQVSQTGNQLLGLLAQQQIKSQQLMASHYRAEAVRQAEHQATHAQAQNYAIKFMGTESVYTRE
ncbi:MAG: P-type conjugative transfer protein TrbJ [Opitutaceae bacterium]|nr:P-type conjugative transfer protein TrbJ [Opitutaceae bacterium]